LGKRSLDWDHYLFRIINRTELSLPQQLSILQFAVSLQHTALVAYTHQFGMSDLMIKKIRAGRRSSTVMASDVSGAKKINDLAQVSLNFHGK